MATRFTIETLLYLRESPQCTKPSNLPPAEEWMGPQPDSARTLPANKSTNDRSRNNEGILLDQSTRRSGPERHVSRGSEELAFGSKTAFQPFFRNTDKTVSKDGDLRTDQRFPLRTKGGESDSGDRFRSNRDRDTKPGFRSRGDTDQDSDGWVPVKPRKSFGNEGAERFPGRMGERPDRFTSDRRPRDDDEREPPNRLRNPFGEFGRDKDGEGGDRPRRTGLNRTRPDQPAWARDTNPNSSETPNPRDRFDRGKNNWRERPSTDNTSHDLQHDKPSDRQYERRWDRDQRQEREPEWLEPAEEKSQAHTGDDLKKFMEAMKAEKAAANAGTQPGPSDVPKYEEPVKAASKSAPTVELDRDRFATFAASEVNKESAVPASKPKSGSRFQSFFATKDEARLKGDSPAPSANIAPPPPQAKDVNPLLALAGLGGMPPSGSQAAAGDKGDAEKAAFQNLLLKLKTQTSETSTPPSAGFSEPPPMNHDFPSKSNVGSPGSFSPYGQERREDPMARALPHHAHEAQAPRPPQPSNPVGMRPEQPGLHELLGQHHGGPPHHLQQPGRVEPPPSRTPNSNTEFLMNLMRQGGSRSAQEPPRQEPPVMRMPQPSRPSQIPPTPDREPDYMREMPRERSTSQHQRGRPAGLPAFFDEPAHPQREQEGRPQQPTQILQRQGPPGLDQMPPFLQNPGQQPPPPGRHMIPPPGLAGNLAGNPRNGPVPGMYPPNFPIGAFPPPEGMAAPPRNMGPPPGFYGGPPPPGGPPGGPPGVPPGFLPHPGMGGFQGPETMGFGFDGRAMPPPGATGPPFRRN